MTKHFAKFNNETIFVCASTFAGRAYINGEDLNDVAGTSIIAIFQDGKSQTISKHSLRPYNGDKSEFSDIFKLYLELEANHPSKNRMGYDIDLSMFPFMVDSLTVDEIKNYFKEKYAE